MIVMESIGEMILQTAQISELIADAIIKRLNPVDDDMSERQAELAYGKRWLRRMKREGLAKCSRVGGKIVYSRHQLNCIRAAEKEMSMIVPENADNVTVKEGECFENKGQDMTGPEEE